MILFAYILDYVIQIQNNYVLILTLMLINADILLNIKLNVLKLNVNAFLKKAHSKLNKTLQKAVNIYFQLETLHFTTNAMNVWMFQK